MYVDAQDLARERQRAADAEASEASREKAAELNDLNERGRAIYRDERLAHLDELVRVELNRHQGYVNPYDLAAEQARVREALLPILAESPDMPLDAFKEIVVGLNRPKLTDAGVEAREELLMSTRTAVYETRADRKATLAAVNAQVAGTKPLLNRLLKETGAGNSVPLARALMSAAADRTNARQRNATGSKPFASLPRLASGHIPDELTPFTRPKPAA